MKKVKEKKQAERKQIKYVNEDTNEVKKFVYILIGVAIIVVLLYFLTAKYLVKDNFQSTDDDTTEVEITYDTVNVGNVFNRPYDTYYVFAYDSSESKAIYYATFVNNFDDDNGKLYFLDLSTEINKKYVGENGNSKATKTSELSLKSPTLIQIKNGKIVNYYEDIDEIADILG
jgi:hypothetical protein